MHFYHRNGQSLPATAAELQSMAAAGAIQPADQVYLGDRQAWTTAGEVDFLAERWPPPAPVAAPPPPPPPPRPVPPPAVAHPPAAAPLAARAAPPPSRSPAPLPHAVRPTAREPPTPVPIADAVQDAARNANLDDIRSLLERLRDLGRNHAVGFLVCAAIAIVPLSLLKSAVWAALMMPARAAAEVAVSSAEGAGRDAAVQSEKLRKLLERKLRKEDIDDAEIDLAKREYAESLRGTGDKAWVAIGAGAGSIMATLLALAATVIANLLLHGLAMPLAKTALTLQAGDLAVGGRGDWKQAWRRALTRLPVLIGAVIPGGVLIAFGTVLFVVPGLIAAFLFSFIAPVALLEGKTWLAALERSARLVLADWVRVAVVFVGLAVASALFRFVLGFGLSPLGFFGSLADDLILLVTVPVHAVAIVLLYVEAREAEDGFDEDGLREALDAGGTT